MGQIGGLIVPMVVLFGAMYFLMIRPQQKKQKADMEMRNSLKHGDEIITIGGIKGRVIKITDDSIIIETTNAKTRLEFVKSAVGMVVKDDIEEDDDDEDEVEIEDEEEIEEKENE